MSNKIDQRVVRAMVIAALVKPRGQGVGLNLNILHNAIIEHARLNNITHDNNGQPTSIWSNTQTGRQALRDDYALCVSDVIWDLIVEGLLRPGSTKQGMGLEWPSLHITDYGNEVLKNPLSPHDPDGYFETLKKEVPNTDEAIKKYLAESLRSHRNNCLLSSTVMVGCASEKAFMLLSDKFVSCLDPTLVPDWDKDMKGKRGIKAHHEVFMEWYRKKVQIPLKRAKGNDCEGETTDALDLFLSYFRKVRNDAGHPTGSEFTKEATLGYLQMFPHYLRRIYELMDWLDTAQPIS